MGIFFLLWLYLCFVGLVSQSIKDKDAKKKIQTIFGGFGLWLVQALRSPICGNDLVSSNGASGYIPTFQQMENYSYLELIKNAPANGMEAGWLIYNKILGAVSNNEQLYLATVAAVIIILIGYTIYKHSQNIILSYFTYACLGLYHFSFSGLRQATAVALIFFSFNFIYEKKPYKFAILVLLASTFHTSAIIFIFVLFLRNIEIKTLRGILLTISSLLFVPFMKSIVQFATAILFSNDKYQNIGNDGGGAVTMFFMYMLFSLLYCSQKIKQNRDIRNIFFLRWMVLLSVIFQSLGFISTGHITRISYYFSVFFLLSIPSLLDNLKSVKEERLLTISSIFALILFHYLVNSNGYLNVVPYLFFWENTFLY